MNIDIIGDIHGCLEEFTLLTKKLGYSWTDGYPTHPEGRKLAFVGDLTDRGPFSIRIMEIVSQLIYKKLAYYTPGNHCDKLYRYFLGRKVQITHGLETTVAEYLNLTELEQEKVKKLFIDLYENSSLYIVLDNGKLVIAHAGIRADYIGKNNDKVKTFVLYGDITGKFNADGTPIRRDWAKTYNGKPIVVYGHTPVKSVRKIGKTYNIDTGAVFGGSLSALRYPEMTIMSVPSSMPYVPEKFRSFEDSDNELFVDGK